MKKSRAFSCTFGFPNCDFSMRSTISHNHVQATSSI